MSQEILYTSVPRGIRPGSQGFCTVKSTAGIGKSLAERLEALSGYRHAYPPPDPRAVDNPVNFAHVILNAGGQQYHVLSRIADAGLDYTRRTNKIAHHVALENFGELTEGGPAWVLEDAAFCETQFDGEPCVLPAGRTPRGGIRSATDCQEWAKLTHDPGWAGALAETMFDSRNRQVTIIFKAGLPPGTTLKLVAEAIALLPPDKRWDVTFSTYFTGLPADVDCRWRFLLDDTKEATQARNNPHAILIDLCNPLKRAEGGTLVEAARAGKAPQWAEVAPATPIRPAYVPPAAGTATMASQPLATMDELQPLPSDPLGLGGVLSPPVTPARPKKAAAKKKPLPYPVIIVGMAVVLLAAIAFFLMMLGGGKPASDPEQIIAKLTEQAASKPSSGDLPDQRIIKATKPEPEKPKETKAPEAPVVKKDETPPPVVKPKEDPFDEKGALADLRGKNGQLALPERAQGLGSAGIAATEIARIKAPPKLCGLELKGAEVVLDGGLEYDLKMDDKSDGSRTWTVRATNKQALGGWQNVAKFSLKDESLRFQWDPNVKPSAHPEKLSCCTLEVRVGKDPSVICSMIQPQQKEHLQIPDLFGEVRIAVPWRQAIAAFKVDQLRVDLRLEGFPPNDMRGQLPIGNTDLLTFEFAKAEPKEPHGFLTVEMKCDIEEGKAVSLALTSFAYPLYMTPDGAKPQREQLTKTAMEKWRLATAESKVKTLQTQKAKLEVTDIPRLKKQLAMEKAALDGRAKAAEVKFPIHDKMKPEEKQHQTKQRELFTYAGVRQCEGLIQEAEGQVAVRQQMVEQIRKSGQWYQRLERLLDDFTRGRIEYRLYGEVKGTKKQIVLVESKSFGNGKSQGR